MKQEELEQIIKDAAKGIFKYNGINPDQSHDDEKFLGHFYHLAKLQETEKEIKETKGNLLPGSKRDLGERLFGSEEIGMLLKDDLVRDAAKEGRKSAQRKMAKYTERNYSELMEIIRGSKNATDIFTNMAFANPNLLYFIGNESHDTVVRFIRAVGEAQGAVQKASQGDSSGMRKIVEKKIEDQDVPDWGRKLLQLYMNDETFLRLVFGEEYQARQRIARAALTTNGRDIDKGKVEDLITDSVIEAQRLYRKETDPKKKRDIYDGGIMPIYMNVAQAVYPVVMERFQKDLERDHGKVKDARERAEEREKAGVGVSSYEVPEYAEDPALVEKV
ncbi:hypothetical protein J4217_02570 [Candidatus Pacearchaeota archaeon]|nr:hypothetical protein [Candidatus Pacearchaeota archaeon]